MAATLPIIDLNAWDPYNVNQSLKTIIDALEKLTSGKERFMDYFLRWSVTRKRSIPSLEKLADELDEHKKNTNISKIVGTSVGIVAGTAGIAGCVLLTAATAGIAPVIAASAAPAFVATGGTIVSTLGGLTAGGSMIAEKVIDSNKVQEAKQILNTDKVHFEPLKEFIIQIIDFEDAVQKIMKFDVFMKLMDLFSEQRDAYQGVDFDRNNAITSLINFDIIDEMPLNSDMKKKLKEFLSFIFSPANRELRRKFSFIVQKINALIFKGGITRVLNVISIKSLQPSFSGGNLFSSVARVGTGAGRVVFPIIGGILNAVAVAIDIVILVEATKSATKGSKSSSGESIRKIVVDMTEELTILQAVYTALAAYDKDVYH